MGKRKRYIALDFGVTGGTATAGSFDGGVMALERLHSFPVQSTDMLGTRYWDFPGLVINAKRGLRACAARHGSELSGVACSSFPLDFGLLDKDGRLLANPVHFLDKRTVGLMDRLHAIIPERSLYQKTGTGARRSNTLYQLFSMALANSPLLDKSVAMLLIADLASYFLSGTPVQEYTLATTTGMYDAESGDWSRDVILSSKIPPVMTPDIIAPGTVIGPLVDSVAAECGLGMLPVIAPASHNTAGSVAAAPCGGGDEWAYVVTGGYNQIGIEVPAPVMNDGGFAAGLTNEGGVDGSFRFAKNTVGTVILERIAGAWSEKDGQEIGTAKLLSLASGAEPFSRIVNPDDPDLCAAENIVEAIDAALERSGQPRATTRGEVVRACVDGIALSIRHALGQLANVANRKFKVVHLLGPMSESPFFCRLLADSVGIPVKAGPAESNALGNILMQAMALGDIGSLSEAREIVVDSFPPAEFQPTGPDAGNDAYRRFSRMA